MNKKKEQCPLATIYQSSELRNVKSKQQQGLAVGVTRPDLSKSRLGVEVSSSITSFDKSSS